jgi:deoxycytidylate deaminase
LPLVNLTKLAYVTLSPCLACSDDIVYNSPKQA